MIPGGTGSCRDPNFEAPYAKQSDPMKQYGDIHLTMDEMAEVIQSVKRKVKLFNESGYKELQLDTQAGHFAKDRRKQLYCTLPGYKSRPTTKCCTLCHSLYEEWHTLDSLGK